MYFLILSPVFVCNSDVQVVKYEWYSFYVEVSNDENPIWSMKRDVTVCSEDVRELEISSP